MNPTLVSALWISLIGMSLVFIALLLLWGLMALIVSTTAKQAAAEVAAVAADETAPGAEEELPAVETPAEVPNGQAAKAAAAAVAVALALRKKTPGHPAAPQAGEPFSAWQSVLRANRLTQKSRMYTRKERGNGK